MGGWFPSTSFNAGALVAREGVREQTAYIVQQGRCEIFRGDGAERRVLREVGPGDVFGEIALFTDAPRTANIRALTDVRLLVVTPAMVGGSSSVAAGFARSCAPRVRATSSSIAPTRLGTRRVRRMVATTRDRRRQVGSTRAPSRAGARTA